MGEIKKITVKDFRTNPTVQNSTIDDILELRYGYTVTLNTENKLVALWIFLMFFAFSI